MIAAGIMRPMLRASCHRAFVLLSVLALAGQLLLPTLHAQSWARQNGDPLLYAVCGQLSPVLALKMQAVTPPELLRKLAQEHQDSLETSCDLCLTVHASALSGGDAPVGGIQPFAAPGPSTAIATVSPRVLLVVLPPLRAPPVIS